MRGRDKNGRFNSGNAGKPKGSKNKLTLALQKAIEQVEKEKGKTLFKHFIERAFKSDPVLVATIKKLIADKIQTTIEAPEGIDLTIRDYDEKKDRSGIQS